MAEEEPPCPHEIYLAGVRLGAQAALGTLFPPLEAPVLVRLALIGQSERVMRLLAKLGPTKLGEVITEGIGNDEDALLAIHAQIAEMLDLGPIPGAPSEAFIDIGKIVRDALDEHSNPRDLCGVRCEHGSFCEEKSGHYPATEHMARGHDGSVVCNWKSVDA